MKPSERRKARHFAVQAIYQWQMTQDNVADIEEQFKLDQDMKGVDLGYFRELLFGVAGNINKLDSTFSPFLSRKLEDLDLVDKAILRLATYELTRVMMCRRAWSSTKRSSWPKPSPPMTATSLSTVYWTR